MLNFYASPYSGYALKVHMLLEELGIPYKYVPVNLQEPAGRKTIDALSPFGKVPAIEHNGFCLGESNAIARYLVQRFERFDLLPANLEDRAHVDMAWEFTENHVALPFMRRAWNLFWAAKFGMSSNLQAVEDAGTELQKSLPRLEASLVSRTYLAGPTVTLADIMLLPFVADPALSQVSLADFPRFDAWRQRMSERTSWKKVQTEMEQQLASRGVK